MFCHFGEHLKCQDDIILKGTFDESKDNTLINFKRLNIINDALIKTTDEIVTQQHLHYRNSTISINIIISQVFNKE